MTAFTDPVSIAEYISENPFTWPGGYELFGITDDGGILRNSCCADELDRIEESIPNDGFYLVEIDSAEMDENEVCDHCGTVIYGLNG